METSSTPPFRCTVWRSTDKGATWSGGFSFPAVADADWFSYINVAANADGSRLLAAATHKTGVFITSASCYVSTNDGASWSFLSTALSGVMGNAVQGDGMAYVDGTTWLAACSNGAIGAIRRSTDNGATWSTVLAAPPSPSGTIPSFLRFSQDAILCHTVSGLYRTADGGLTWSTLTTPPSANGSGSCFIRIDDTWGVYLMAGKVFETLDAGDTWVEVATVAGMSGFQTDGVIGVDRHLYVVERNSGQIWRSDDAVLVPAAPLALAELDCVISANCPEQEEP